MKLKAVSGLMFTLLLIGMLTPMFNIKISKAESRTWTVDDDGPADFCTIQEAINVASSGDTVFVKTGIYYEHVVLDKTLFLIGQDKSNTVIDGEDTGYVVYVASNRTSITGFTIQKSGFRVFSSKTNFTDHAGIYLTNANYCNITNNTITKNQYGIWLDHSSNHNTASKNNITENNNCGIWLRRSSGNSISGNDITANSQSGILLLHSSNNVLRNNKMANNLYNFRVLGMEFSHFVNDVDVSNTVDGKPIYYWINEQDMAVPLDAGYIALVNCTNITIRDLSLTHNDSGVLLAYTANSTITRNIIKNNIYGIWLLESSGNSISGNDIAKNWAVGIAIQNSSGNSISGNNMGDNCASIWFYESSNNSISANNITTDLPMYLFGVVIEESSGNNISGNNIENHPYGIYLDHSSSNTISGNSVIANGDAGINLDHSSDYNSVSRNNIKANKDYGILVCDSSGNSFSGNNIVDNKVGIKLVNSSDNSILHNNFIDNTIQACHENEYYPTYPSMNTWDDDYEGNYWSDYTGVDSNNDGIGDTPYVIDENNQDNYPLMSESSIPEDVNNDGEVNILDVTIVARAFGSYPGHPLWNPNADVTNPYGIIDILDVAAVAMEYKK